MSMPRAWIQGRCRSTPSRLRNAPAVRTTAGRLRPPFLLGRIGSFVRIRAALAAFLFGTIVVASTSRIRTMMMFGGRGHCGAAVYVGRLGGAIMLVRGIVLLVGLLGAVGSAFGQTQ